MMISGFIQAKFHTGFARQAEELYKNSAKILSEAVRNFPHRRQLLKRNSRPKDVFGHTGTPLKQAQYSQLYRECCSALVSSCRTFCTRDCSTSRLSSLPNSAIILATPSSPSTPSSSPQWQSAKSSSTLPTWQGLCGTLFGLRNSRPEAEGADGKESSDAEVKGRIEFKDVSFKYPTRTDLVLEHFNLVIEAGQKTAIVGISGSGKSTIIQLIERFYDVDAGEILIDGVNIKEYDVAHLRKSMGYVPQEPVLFDTTIEENVKYGRDSTKREEVEEACRIANAYDFVMKDEEKAHEEAAQDEKKAEGGSGTPMDTAKPLETQKQQNEDLDLGKGFDQKGGRKRIATFRWTKTETPHR